VTAFHGYVDESIRPGTYRLTLVRLASADLVGVARAVRESIPSGQYRLHLSSEGTSRRRQILRALSRLPLTALVFETPYDGRGDDQAARDRCLSALVDSLGSLEVTVLVLDTRGHERDRRDRARLGPDLATAGLDDRVTHSHRGSRDELLIALPDAIGWAAGASRPWPDLVRSVCEIRRVTERG